MKKESKEFKFTNNQWFEEELLDFVRFFSMESKSQKFKVTIEEVE